MQGCNLPFAPYKISYSICSCCLLLGCFLFSVVVLVVVVVVVDCCLLFVVPMRKEVPVAAPTPDSILTPMVGPAAAWVPQESLELPEALGWSSSSGVINSQLTTNNQQQQKTTTNDKQQKTTATVSCRVATSLSILPIPNLEPS